MLKKCLGQRIYTLRKARGYSQEKLAELSDYSVDFISLVERGINAPSVEGCERIARSLKIKLCELFDFNAKTVVPLLSKKQTKDRKVKRPAKSGTPII